MELVVAPGLAHPCQAVAKIVGVAVEEPFLLNEVDEHQPIEHQRRVPLQIGLGLDPLDELEKRGMLGLKAVVELFGDLIDVERSPRAAGHVHDGDLFLFLQPDGDFLQPLDQCIALLPDIEAMVAAGQRLARLAAHPMPDLLAGGLVHIDDEVLPGRFGDLLIDLQANGALGNGIAHEGREAALLGYGIQADRVVVDRDVEMRLVIVPAQVLAEQRAEVKRLQARPDRRGVELHGHRPSINRSCAAPTSK
jgi:hypothetical protein